MHSVFRVLIFFPPSYLGGSPNQRAAGDISRNRIVTLEERLSDCQHAWATDLQTVLVVSRSVKDRRRAYVID